MDKKPLMLALKHTDRAWACYMRKVALEAGIPDSYRPIVMFLARNGQASQKELAAFSQTTYAAVSRTVKEMEMNGYINKETADGDKRYARLSLTEKGLECDRRMRDKVHEGERIIAQTLGEEKSRELEQILLNITDIIKEQL